jgi:hypothetical protein
MESTKFLLSIICFLSIIIFSLIQKDRNIKEILKYLKLIFYFLKFKKYKSFASEVLLSRNYLVPTLDEMIGFFKSEHIGLYTFHNGVIDFSKKHLFKISMIDERSRLYSLIVSNQNLPASVFKDVVYNLINNDYYCCNLELCENIYLTETYSMIPSIKYLYFTIEWNNDIPVFMVSIATNKPILEEDLNKIRDYRVVLKKTISGELESTKYDNLKY